MGLGMEKLNLEAARKNAILADPNTAGLSSCGSATPFSLNTPEILNSLINITNPFFPPQTTTNNGDNEGQNTSSQDQNGLNGDEKKTFLTLEPPNGGQGQGSKSPVYPPRASVKSMRSQLIKEGLKLTIQSKRKKSGKEELDVKKEILEAKQELRLREEVLKNEMQLTPEDEERRRRRRERNKVAATKCRNKKKEKTVLLAQESESLESSVLSLKSEISKLEIEKQRLMEALQSHEPTCKRRNFGDFNHNEQQQQHQQQQQQQLNFNNFFPSTTTTNHLNNHHHNHQQHNNHLNQRLQL